MRKYSKTAISLLIIGGTTIVVSSGIGILYSVQRNLIYTSNYPEGSRKHVKINQSLYILLNFDDCF